VDNYGIKPEKPLKPDMAKPCSDIFDLWITLWYDVYMTHDCTYALDLDGQVTCTICGAMDDDMTHSDDMDSNKD
jgi:hypothetical protein